MQTKCISKYFYYILLQFSPIYYIVFSLMLAVYNRKYVADYCFYVKLCLDCKFTFFLFFPLWRCDPKRVMASSFLRFSRSHTTTQHSRQDSSGRVINSSQRPLPDSTQHSQDKHPCSGGIRTHDLSRRAGRRTTPQTARPLGPAPSLFTYLHFSLQYFKLYSPPLI